MERLDEGVGGEDGCGKDSVEVLIARRLSMLYV